MLNLEDIRKFEEKRYRTGTFLRLHLIDRGMVFSNECEVPLADLSLPAEALAERYALPALAALQNLFTQCGPQRFEQAEAQQ